VIDFPDVVSEIKPAVVAIGIRPEGHDAPFRHYVDEAESSMPLDLLGTGFCVHPRGIIVTCQQVVHALTDIIGKKDIPTASAVAVFTSYDRDGRGIIRGIPCNRILAPGGDIGLMELRPHTSALPTIAGGESYDVAAGEEIGICGYPLGDDTSLHDTHPARTVASVQKGIISAILPSEFANTISELVISAPVFPGYIGAPVFHAEQPELLGVIKAIAPATINVAGQELPLPYQNTASAIPGPMMAKAIDLGIQALVKKRGR
jgi:hypothetical protein